MYPELRKSPSLMKVLSRWPQLSKPSSPPPNYPPPRAALGLAAEVSISPTRGVPLGVCTAGSHIHTIRRAPATQIHGTPGTGAFAGWGPVPAPCSCSLRVMEPVMTLGASWD